MDWGGGQVDVGLAALQSSSAWLLDPAFMAENYTDPTIVRLLVAWQVRNSNSPANGGFAAIGIIAWDSGDLAAPSVTPAPAPDPLDARFDWMYRMVVPYPAATPVSFIVGPSTEWQTTSRAMRKLGNQKGLLLCLSTDADLSAFFAVDVRYAIKDG